MRFLTSVLRVVENDSNTTYRVFLDQEHKIVRSQGDCKGFLCVQAVRKLCMGLSMFPRSSIQAREGERAWGRTRKRRLNGEYPHA